MIVQQFVSANKRKRWRKQRRGQGTFVSSLLSIGKQTDFLRP